MLKRISTRQLRVGMFVQELCGSWIEHPFWRSSVALRTEADVRRITDSAVKECVIDTDRGIDVLQAPAPAPAPAPIPVPAVRGEPLPVRKTSLQGELEQARAICMRGRDKVVGLFNEARLGKAVDAEECLPLVDEISSSIMRNPGAIISLARLKTQDEYTYMHSVTVCALMVSLAQQLGMNAAQRREAGLAGLLHDLGKSFIPLEVLNKPGRLTEQEFAIVQTHPVKGYEALLEGKGVSGGALDVCRHHHEKIDGTGYPDGLKGAEISLLSKMGAVCDVYDAITSNRPYKMGWDPADSIKKMAEWSKGHFDDMVFQAFVCSIGIYPTGSIVLLASGRLAVVVEQNTKSLLSPLVKVFFSTLTKLRVTPFDLDLSATACQDRIVNRESLQRWGLDNVDTLWMGGQLAV